MEKHFFSITYMQHQFFYTSTRTISITILTVDNSFALQYNRTFTFVVFFWYKHEINSEEQRQYIVIITQKKKKMEGQEESTLREKLTKRIATVLHQ